MASGRILAVLGFLALAAYFGLVGVGFQTTLGNINIDYIIWGVVCFVGSIYVGVK